MVFNVFNCSRHLGCSRNTYGSFCYFHFHQVRTRTLPNFYFRYNETPVVKASGRELSYILLISMIMCYMMTFVLISKPNSLLCAFKRTGTLFTVTTYFPLGIGFAFSCLYSAMLVKTTRIYRIFSQATRSAQRPKYISPLSQVYNSFSFLKVRGSGCHDRYARGYSTSWKYLMAVFCPPWDPTRLSHSGSSCPHL